MADRATIASGGSTQNDHLYGGSGDDNIDGVTGSDIIVGGFGADTLTGGGAPGNSFQYWNPRTVATASLITLLDKISSNS